MIFIPENYIYVNDHENMNFKSINQEICKLFKIIY